MNTPHSQPSPPQEGKGLEPISPLPVGEGGVMAYSVFFLMKDPLPRLRRYFPQRGKIKERHIFPLWGKWPGRP